MVRGLRLVVGVLVASFAAVAWAGDVYYRIPVRDLKFTEGDLPARNPALHWRRLANAEPMTPYVVVDGEGEAYVVDRDAPSGVGVPSRDLVEEGRLVARGPADKDLRGRLFVPNADLTGMVGFPFVLPASVGRPEEKQAFYLGKAEHYERLLDREIPGGAWFRHQARLARVEVSQKTGERPPRPARSRRDGDEITRTYDLFTGGRAMSENLQLDRELPALRSNETPVKLDSISGITIREIDWKPLIGDAQPKLDPLASKIPADQHVVFFASFQTAMAVADETKLHDTPLLRLAQPRAEDAGVVERYQRQLGLSMSTIARLLGPTFAKSVAMTGSDPFFPMGTDLAVLFETRQPTVLENLILSRITLAVAPNKEARAISGEVAGLKYRGFRSPDRAVSSYVAQLDDAVVVTNSPYQLSRLMAVRKGEAKSIASLPEYQFFRIRYPLGDPEESAMAFLSDPTIRRWCGPRWRIGDSRRTRAAAVLAELQASQLDALVKKTVRPGPLHTDLPILGGGELTLTPDGVVSSTIGTLDFMTPIGEMPLEEVTRAEADAYNTWRDGYQRNWTWFDPIALRLSLSKEKLAGDMTVMPLILGSDYREFTEISLGGRFVPTAGDPHGALAHLIVAVNRQSRMIREVETVTTNMGRAVSLGWIGEAVSGYVEDDPFWADLAKADPDHIDKFMDENAHRIPLAVRIESASALKLAAFLVAARAFIEQSGPGLTQWESLTYHDRPYVRISSRDRKDGPRRGLDKLVVCYTTVDDALTITLSEKILRQTIDRALAREKARAEGKPADKETQPWLGSNVGLRVDAKVLEVANALQQHEHRREMQARCWGNLPILNAWKRLYPDRDPVALHRQVWGVELVCPAGGKYVWNAKYGTMESTVYGHPGEPKKGPPAPPVLSTFVRGEFGLTFENQGLRARAVLHR